MREQIEYILSKWRSDESLEQEEAEAGGNNWVQRILLTQSHLRAITHILSGKSRERPLYVVAEKGAGKTLLAQLLATLDSSGKNSIERQLVESSLDPTSILDLNFEVLSTRNTTFLPLPLERIMGELGRETPEGFIGTKPLAREILNEIATSLQLFHSKKRHLKALVPLLKDILHSAKIRTSSVELDPTPRSNLPSPVAHLKGLAGKDRFVILVDEFDFELQRIEEGRPISRFLTALPRALEEVAAELQSLGVDVSVVTLIPSEFEYFASSHRNHDALKRAKFPIYIEELNYSINDVFNIMDRKIQSIDRQTSFRSIVDYLIPDDDFERLVHVAGDSPLITPKEEFVISICRDNPRDIIVFLADLVKNKSEDADYFVKCIATATSLQLRRFISIYNREIPGERLNRDLRNEILERCESLTLSGILAKLPSAFLEFLEQYRLVSHHSGNVWCEDLLRKG